MKKLFVKEDNTGLWVAAAISGAIAAGVGIWFYIRGKRAAELEAERLAHAQDYLGERRPKKKKHKTDISELGDIVHHAQA
jgi:hypothetical protein